MVRIKGVKKVKKTLKKKKVKNYDIQHMQIPRGPENYDQESFVIICFFQGSKLGVVPC